MSNHQGHGYLLMGAPDSKIDKTPPKEATNDLDSRQVGSPRGTPPQDDKEIEPHNLVGLVEGLVDPHPVAREEARY